MTTIAAKTYSGTFRQMDEKLFKKAVKACVIRGQYPLIDNPTPEQVVKYLHAKSASFQHALHKADLYSMKVIGRNIFIL